MVEKVNILYKYKADLQVKASCKQLLSNKVKWSLRTL
jgi:hypothetical protein